MSAASSVVQGVLRRGDLAGESGYARVFFFFFSVLFSPPLSLVLIQPLRPDADASSLFPARLPPLPRDGARDAESKREREKTTHGESAGPVGLHRPRR